MIRSILANVACSDLEESLAWYERLFARPPDARPMTGLAEWHQGEASGFQLFHDEERAGHCAVTLIVAGIAGERTRLSKAGFHPGPIEEADYTTIFRLNDPDGNLVVLAENKAG